MTSDQPAEDRLTAALADRYQIEGEIGSGGMATVYLAQDLKHDRRVAVKVLKPELAAVVGTERFLAEIRTTANLSPPHILPLFDSGEASGFLFYVMPYVEGESLGERLDRGGQLPVEEAVRIASHVADALDYAHQQGVIHRDIKPGNVLFQAGDPVVTDFGIALAVSAAGEGRLTETGLSLGTPYYMSPEQAAGDQTPTAASDVYSLGCVLYEMLTGDPPHTGSSAQAILGKILLGEVTRPTKLRRTIPANVEGALLKALERLPADRFESAAELATALKDKTFRHGVGVGAGADVGPWKTATFGLAGVAVVLAALTLWAWPRPESSQVVRFAVALPPDSGFVPSYGPSIARSPDGSRMVYVGPGVETQRAIWVKDFDQLEPRRLPGTEGAFQPFFSPDGQSVGFIAAGDISDRTVKIASLQGGPVREVTAVPGRGGGAWGPDEFIYIYGGHSGISKVPARGGDPSPVTTLQQGETQHIWPEVLPNGRGMVFTVMRRGWFDYRNADIAVADLDTGEHTILMPGALARYAPPGYLVVVEEDGSLMAASFDQDRRTAGPTVPLARRVVFNSRAEHGVADLTISGNGILLYVQGNLPEVKREFVWVDRGGAETPVSSDLPPALFSYFSLSPDDSRLAYTTGDDGRLWVKELPEGPPMALTPQEGPHSRRPVWADDGRTLAYIVEGADTVVQTIRADGSDMGASEVLLDRDRGVWEIGFTPEGEGILFREGEGGAEGTEVWYLSLDPDSTPERQLATGYYDRSVVLSPDGRWMAYVSDFSGQDQVFLRRFRSADPGLIQISTNGGTEPVWAHNGRELFFRDLSDGNLVSASLSAGPEMRVEGRTVLFDASEYVTQANWQRYDVSGDDQRFLFIRPLSAEIENFALVLVQDFSSELQNLVGEGR